MPQAFNEACRMVALRLGQSCQSREFHSVVFSSTRTGESVTPVVDQIACQLRSTFGYRTLIVRLRTRPRGWSFARWFRLGLSRRTNSVAIANSAAAESETLAHAIEQASETDLVVELGEAIAGGRSPAIVPSLKKVMELLAGKIDFVLVDAPAITESGEAYEAATVVPRIVLVVESGLTQTETLEQIKSQMSAFKMTLIGTILRQHRNPVPSWMEKWLTQ